MTRILDDFTRNPGVEGTGQKLASVHGLCPMGTEHHLLSYTRQSRIYLLALVEHFRFPGGLGSYFESVIPGCFEALKHFQCYLCPASRRPWPSASGFSVLSSCSHSRQLLSFHSPLFKIFLSWSLETSVLKIAGVGFSGHFFLPVETSFSWGSL